MTEIIGGKLILKNRSNFESAVKSAPQGTYFLTLEKFYKQRSIQQNKARFGVLYKTLKAGFIEVFGESVDIEYIHDICKQNCLPSEYVERLKKEHKENNKKIKKKKGYMLAMPFRLTTTKLTTLEEMEYCENIRKFAAEYLQIELPEYK